MADFTRIVKTRDEVRAAAINCFNVANALVDAHKRVRLEACEDDDRTIQQNRFYWGVVCRETAEQARIEGVKYAPEAWHELAKRLHLGYEIRAVRVAGKSRPTYIRRLRSTTDLKVGAMSRYIEQTMAWAVTDFGVRFSETRWQDWYER
jgi:hypothetical protein